MFGNSTKAPPIHWTANRGGQSLFLKSPHFQVLGSGSRGGGKTDALLFSYLNHVGQGWGSDWRGLILRRTFPQLRDIIARSQRWIPRIFPGAKYNKTERQWNFPDGEVLIFSYMNTLTDYEQFHGSAWTFLGFEELTAWPTSECYEAMTSCVRSDRKGIPLLIRSNTNSWGSGFQWVKSRFVDFAEPFKSVGEKGRERVHIPMNWEENLPFREADPDYHVRLAEDITNESQLKAWLYNSWDIMAGGYFADVWRDALHWIAPFDIPVDWYVDRSHDWGSSAPFATLWYAESNGEAIPDGRSWPRGTIFVINEDYGCAGDPEKPNWKPNVGLELLPKDIAARVKATEARMLSGGLLQRKPAPGPGDDPLWDVSRGESMAKQMADAGVLWTRPSKGPGSRVTGWMAIAQRLKAGHKQPIEEPGLFVFQTCKHLHRVLPSLPRDAKKPDDIASDSEDHCADSLRYRVIKGLHGTLTRQVDF